MTSLSVLLFAASAEYIAKAKKGWTKNDNQRNIRESLSETSHS